MVKLTNLVKLLGQNSVVKQTKLTRKWSGGQIHRSPPAAQVAAAICLNEISRQRAAAAALDGGPDYSLPEAEQRRLSAQAILSL